MGYDWFKFYSKGRLEGSVRVQLTPAERSVWVDLLCFANECRERGVIARAPGIPYTREDLATRFGVDLPLLNSTIEKCSMDKNKTNDKHRIELRPDGTIDLTNWEHYNPSPKKQDKKEEAREGS